ncbi:hypothetical protein [Aestuariivirga litoralis]|uniref:hypothetical protein n=1 Tax=Aestuariivirga litoralis TaxID=2650924 RepID=UPI0018C66CDA|nr:hypothetical protein [Aestuariivirga litoralis]MBG1233966.1 hypothetical protein [Aestuariivirga litoralis]
MKFVFMILEMMLRLAFMLTFGLLQIFLTLLGGLVQALVNRATRPSGYQPSPMPVREAKRIERAPQAPPQRRSPWL